MHKAKMKKINDHKPKNWKIDSATALINSLYGTLGKRTVFGNLRGRAHGRRLEVVKDTPLKKGYPPEGPKGHKEPKDTSPQGPKWQNGGREAKMKAQKAKTKGNEGAQSQNEEN